MMDFVSYQEMMGGGASFFMWFTYSLVVIALVLVILALGKYLKNK